MTVLQVSTHRTVHLHTSKSTNPVHYSRVNNSRRTVQGFVVRNEAIPGPLFMSGEDGDFLKGVKSAGSFIKFPVRSLSSIKRTPPLVRVRLSVEYRVHSRQMLCVGGSAIPFGWSFLSIAKVPMSWEPNDVWVVEVELPAGSKVEYKYVILEEQDWTQQVNANSEGTVDYSYRVQPETSPPDVQKITRKMAIVAWQSGANRVLHVPSEKEIYNIPKSKQMHREFEADASSLPTKWTTLDADTKIFVDTSQKLSQEVLYIDEENRPILERRDVWGVQGVSPYR